MKLVYALCFATACATTLACGEDSEDCASTNSCTPFDGSGGASGSASGGTGGSGGSAAGGSGGSAAAGGAGGSGGSAGNTGCDPTLSPSEDRCVIADEYAIFVSPGGNDNSTKGGTQEAPYATLSVAIAQAKLQGKKRIYACTEGNSGFTESVTLDASHSGMEFYGGFSNCVQGGWDYNNIARAVVSAPTPVAWRVTGITSTLVIEGFDITAADATDAGTSSFGMIVADSAGVTLRRVNLKAGKGANGAPGEDGVQGADGAPPGTDQKGKDATCTNPLPQAGGGWSGLSACGSKGGTGGAADVAANGDNGNAGIPDTNVSPAGVNNAGSGATVVGDSGGPGQPGSNGLTGNVATAAAAQGTFTATGYTPADGNPGTNGFPGQGGGGGGASKGTTTCVGASGGAGGMGGCGGGRGAGGGGGGASVALLAWMSEVTLDTAELVASDGGIGTKGGDAATGGGGSGGGAGGAAAGSVGPGGRGGDGGRGGSGGSGSGGSGGPSYALVFHGTPPTESGVVTLTPGAGGAPGLGGALQTDASNPAPNGSQGASAEQFEQT